MNAPLNLFIFLIFICLLIPLLLFFLKLRKKNYRLAIQETKLDQISQEVSKKQHEIDFVRRKLEEQKIKLEQEESRIKTEREKLAIESQKISEEKIFHEQEKNKLQERIQNVKEKFQDIINKVDRKNVEVEKKIREIECNRKNIEIDSAKLEAAKKEINDASKQIQSEWQKIRLEKERLEKRKKELDEKEDEIRKRNQKLLEERKSIDAEKERINSDWQKIEVKKAEFAEEVLSLDEREKEINEKGRQLEIERKFIENEKSQIENEWQHIKAEREKLEKPNAELNKQANDLKKQQKQLEDKERHLDSKRQELAEKEKELKREREEFETAKSIPPIKPEQPVPKPIPVPRPKPDGSERMARVIPELICQKKAGYWQVAIKISDRLPDYSHLKIIQDGINLVKDELNEEFWPLNSLSSILITWNDGDKLKKKKFQMYSDGVFKPLLFKLGSQSENFAKFVNSSTAGNYLVIVPEDWHREETLSGSAPCEPEHISIRGFKGHFFILKKAFNTIIAFKNSAGELVTFEPKSSRFDLKGNPITDANEEVGPLFSGELPIIIDSIRSWNDIEVVVIEDEGEEKSEHQWIFTPDINSSEIDLNQAGLQGDIHLFQSTTSSFSISIYDKEYHLIDNLYFRYIRGLRKIIISDHSIVPLSNGHQSVDIKFLHDKSCSIKIQKNENNRVIIKHHDEETTAIIPPDSAWDLTDWEIQDGDGRKVNIELLVERIWWNEWNEKDSLASITWTANPLNIPKDFLTPTSSHAISLQFPKLGWIKNIAVGFNRTKIRQFKLIATQRSVKIPLREFSDCEKIFKSIDQAKLLLWIDKDGIQSEVIIARLESKFIPIHVPEPEPLPTELNKKPCCYNCDHARRKFKISWCRRSNWPQQVFIEDFEKRIAYFKCGEWRGEYLDKNGDWVSK